MHEEVLHNHKQLSMAVQKSERWVSLQNINETGHYRPYRRPFLDSRRIFHFLSEIQSDPFAHSLFSLRRVQTEEQELPIGMRILPVYVLSLFQQSPQLTLLNFTMVAETQDAILVLQTNATNISIPFFYGQEKITMSGGDTTRHILAGVLSVLGGIVNPWVALQSTNTVETDFRWAVGYHPFGPFMTQCTRISHIFHDTIIRNGVISAITHGFQYLNITQYLISRMAQAYLYTEAGSEVSYTDTLPFYTDLLYTKAQLPQVKQELQILTENIQYIVDDLKRIDQLLRNNLFNDAYQLSTLLHNSASNIYTQIEQELMTIEEALVCCFISHQVQNPFSSHRYIAMGFLSVFIFLCLRFILKPRKSVGISQRMQRGMYNQGATNPKRFL